MSYPSHGRAVFRRDGHVVFADLYGPWNIECIREAYGKAAPLVQEMHRDGPWGMIVRVHGSMLGTSDAVKEFRKDVVEFQGLGRVGVAWVVDPSVEGHEVMQPVIEGIYRGVFPLRFFTTLPAAQRWIKELVDAALAKKTGR